MTGYPDMPPARIHTVNGVRLAVFEAGPEDGLPVVLSHGFPELAYSWRHQIRALAAAGYRVIAPDQRGYGFSEAPAAITAYDMEHLTGDLVGLLDLYGLERAVFCGHDWGGLVVWQLPLMHPSRVAGLMGLCTPFIPRLRADPVQLMRQALGEGFYIVAFQEPGVADALLDSDPGRTMRFFGRKSPVPADEADKTASNAKLGNLHAALTGPESEWGGVPSLSDAELTVFTQTFARTGFTGGINWYRNMTRNWERSAHLPTRVDVPALMIGASHDLALPPSGMAGMHKYVPDLERHVVAGAGHWVQQEAPDAVNALMLDWLARRRADLA